MAVQYTGHMSPAVSHDHYTALPVVEFLVKQYWRINAKENRIYIRGEFKESLGMNFFQSLSAWKGVQTVQIM